MRRLLFVAMAALTLAVTGCSNTSSPEPPPPTQPELPATTTSPAPSATPSAAVSNCLDGRYRLVRFVGAGSKGAFGTGEGGDVTVTFDEGAYVLRGAGEDPIQLTLAGQTADLLVDGSISGDYRVQDSKATFSVGKGTGTATLAAGSSKESLSMAEVGNVLAPDGEAGLACADDAMIVTLQDVRLELGKV
jgi:hypothetical protein